MDYPSLLTERVLAPLGMAGSTVGGEYPLGAGGVSATIADLTRYARACLCPPPDALGAAITFARQPVVDLGAGSWQALGWVVRAGAVCEHSGGTRGFSACATVDHGRGRAAAVLTDVPGGPARSDQLKRAARLALAGEDRRGPRRYGRGGTTSSPWRGICSTATPAGCTPGWCRIHHADAKWYAGTMTEWMVDDRCTNCDVARQLAPGLIEEVDGRSAVVRQPRTAAEEAAVHAAAHACHTRSIRPGSGPLDPATDPFPLALDDGVYLCGHNSRRTAGANSYLLLRPDGTLMMIDTPRWSAALADRYAALGPVTDVLLTHRDHAAHGRDYADRFGARLWIHEGDLAAAPTADRVLRGVEPVEIADGVTAHPLPGHTQGSVLYLADDRLCFTGDSFYWSRTTGDLEVWASVTWYSITALAESLERTAPHIRFEWVLPGHGDRRRRPAQEMATRLLDLTARTARLAPQPVDFTALPW